MGMTAGSSQLMTKHGWVIWCLPATPDTGFAIAAIHSFQLEGASDNLWCPDDTATWGTEKRKTKKINSQSAGEIDAVTAFREVCA
jgi:hypothetical protein